MIIMVYSNKFVLPSVTARLRIILSAMSIILAYFDIIRVWLKS